MVVDSRSSRSLTEFTDDKEKDHSVNPTRLLSGTVPEVKDGLESIPKAEYPDILEREKQGKNRTGVTEFLEKEIREIPEASERQVRSWICEYVAWVIYYPDSIENSVDQSEVIDFVYSSNSQEYAFLERSFVIEQLEYLVDHGTLYKSGKSVFCHEDDNEGDS